MVEPDKTPGSEGAPNGTDLTVRLLTAPTALAQLSTQEATIVVSFMQPAFYPDGTCFIKEGDASDAAFMALVIQGEVIVENITMNRTAPITAAVLGPGSLVGEMGLLDHGPRSASCIAGTDLYCAVLTRDAFFSLIVKEPVLGAKLMLGVSVRIAQRLRDTARKLKVYATLCQSMQEEMDELLKQVSRKRNT